MLDIISTVSYMLSSLDINIDKITNIYHFGSYVHKTNTNISDYDILVLADFNQPRSQFRFHKDGYFHYYKKISNENPKIDIILYSCKNFEELLKRHFIITVECLFFPHQYILLNKIDYKTIFLDRYLDKKLIKESLIREYRYSHYYYDKYEKDDQYRNTEGIKYLIFKRLYNVIKYMYNFIQLIRYKDIYGYGHYSDLFKEIKDNLEDMSLNDIYETKLKQEESKLIKVNQSIE